MALLGGVTKALFGAGGEGEQQAALETIRDIPLPVLKQYYPELYKQVATLNPEVEQAVNLGPSQMAGISTDPALRQAQMKALAKLQEVGDAGGRDAQFMADQARLEGDVNANLQGQQGAIMQNLATRGMSGGGSELVARQMAAQQASNKQAQMAMDLNAQAQQRALSAIMQSGQLGGQMQGQDFSQAAQKAQAADAISRFNAENLQQVGNNNVNTRNAAQQWNATMAQNTSNQNTGLKNDAQQYNANLAQQNFNNQMSRASGVAQQYSNIAAGKNAERAGDMQLTGNLIGAAATGGASIAAQSAASAAAKQKQKGG